MEKLISTAKLQRWRRPPESRLRLPMISVIIPAHNEEAYLGATLRSLSRQNYHKFEVIVVANGCRDRTVEMATGRCSRLIVLPDKNLGRARNAGAQIAQGELLVFLDADTTLELEALTTIAQSFTRRHAAGTLKGVPDCPRWRYRMIYLLKNGMHRWALHPGSVGVILCWKDRFEAVGGFDERLEVMENSELMKRLQSWGKYRFIGETAAVTSMRRYERIGAGRTAWLWMKLWVESWFVSLRNKRYETIR